MYSHAMTKPRPIRTATEHSVEVPRTARYYVLGDIRGGDLWIVLHGFGQLAGDFVEYFAELNDGHHVVVAPEALNRYYTAGLNVPSAERAVGATWMTREFRDAENEYRHRVLVIGFSQGGATASRWAVRGKAAIHTLVLWGATLPPDLDLASAKARLEKLRLRIVIGKTDQYISPDAVTRERVRLDASGVPHEVIEYDAGHSIKRGVLKELAARIESA